MKKIAKYYVVIVLLLTATAASLNAQTNRSIRPVPLPPSSRPPGNKEKILRIAEQKRQEARQESLRLDAAELERARAVQLAPATNTSVPSPIIKQNPKPVKQ